MAKSVYVPRAGGIVEFPDSATPQQMVAYIDKVYGAPDVAAAPTAEPEAGQFSTGPVGSAVYSFGAGLAGIPEGLVGQFFPEEYTANTWAGKLASGAEGGLGYLLGRDPTKEQTTAEMLGGGVGSIGTFLLPGTAAAKGARLVGAGVEFAAGAGTAANILAGVGSGSKERMDRIRQQKAAGMDISDDQSQLAQNVSGVIGVLDILPVQKYIKPLEAIFSKVSVKSAPILERILQNRLGRIARTGAEEGVQEAVQGILDDVAEQNIYNPDIQIGEDVLSNAAVGGFSGSVLEAVIQAASGRKLRGLRQLNKDLGQERQQSGAELRTGQIAQAAEDLRQYNVDGPVDIVQEEFDGLTGFTIKTPAGNRIGSFDSEAEAQQAIDLYSGATGAKVSVRKAPSMTVAAPKAFPVKIGNKVFKTYDEIVTERDRVVAQRESVAKFVTEPEIFKAEALRQNAPEEMLRAKAFKELQRQDKIIATLNAYIPSESATVIEPETPDVPAQETVEAPEPVVTEEQVAPDTETETAPLDEMPEDLADEKPVGYEPPVEEARYIEDEPVTDEFVPEDNAPDARVERRSTINADQVTELKTELFGEPLSHSEMTPEQIALYEAERDKRYPQEDVELYYRAAPTNETPRLSAPTAQPTTEPRPFTPEYKAKMDAVYTELRNRLKGIVPEDVDLKLQTFIDTQPGMLIKGYYSGQGEPIITLAQGIYDPSLSVEKLVEKMVGELNHEAIHALRGLGLFRKGEWNMLSRAVNTKMPGKKYSYLDKARAIYQSGGEGITDTYNSEDVIVEEAVAEMYRDWVNQKNNKEVRQVGGLFNRITEFFRRLFRVFRNERHKAIFADIEAGKLKDRTPQPRETTEAKFSASPVELRPAAIQTDDGVEIVPYKSGSSSSVYLRRDHSPIQAKGRPNIPALGAAFDRAFEKRFGRKYDLNNPEDYNEIVTAIVDEVKHQMQQAQSGVGWYDEDIQLVFDELSKSFPQLKDPEKGVIYRRLFTLITGIMSGGMKAKENVEKSAINFAHFLNTGKFADINPYTQKGWNHRVNIMGPQIAMVNSMMSDPRFAPSPGSNDPEFERLEKFVEFMYGQHTVKEINRFRALHGTPSPVKGVGGVNDKRIGVYAFGAKFGPFISNLNGISDETVDLWAARSFYRHMGNSLDANGKMIDAPLGKHRESMKRALRDVADRTELSSRDVQAVLWFYEKELYNQLGQRVPLEVFSDGAKEFTRKYGSGADRPPQSRTDRERAIAQSVSEAGDRGRTEAAPRFSAAPVDRRESIYASAIKVGDEVFEAGNHADALSVAAMHFDKTEDELIDAGVVKQGFTTNRGRFVDRLEAARIIDPEGTELDAGEELASEDIDWINATNRRKSKQPDGAKFSAAPVDPEEFKRWFRNSKVVNPDGTPKVMYHGTSARVRFTTFDTLGSEIGSHFGTQKQANKFVMIEEDEPRTGGRIYPVFLSIQNPLRLRDLGNWDNEKVAFQLIDKKLIDADTYEKARMDRSLPFPEYSKQDREVREMLQKAIRRAGYDGIVYLNRFEGLNSDPENTINVDFKDDREITDLTDAEFKKYLPEAEDSYIIFAPTQVKSTLNEFRKGENRRLRFSAAPLPTYIETQNQTLFTQSSDVPFWKNTLDFLFGTTPGKTVSGPAGTVDISGRTMAALRGRAGMVDGAAFVEFMEKQRNKLQTGNFEREVADTSALASLALRRRASHMTASFIMMGNLGLDYSTPGDILTATLKAENNPDSLKEVFRVLLEPAADNSITGKPQTKADIFKTYASAIRGRDFKAKGMPVPRELTDQYINTTIPFVQQNYPEVVEAYNMYQRVNKNLLTTARDAGLISTAELGRLTDKMNYYGFYREAFEEELVPGIPSKTASKFDLREYRGSDAGKLMGDPLQVIISNTQFWVDAIAKNLATTKTFDLARSMGEARLLGASEKPDQSLGEAPEVMFYRQNGVQKRFAVKDPLWVTALGADERVDIGMAMKMIGAPTRWIRESVTRDPGFMIANLLRDTVSSWITSGEDFTPFIGTAMGLKDALNSGTSFQALMGRGVVGSYDMAMQGPKELAATIRRRYTPKNVHMITTPEGLKNVGMGLWDKLGVWSEASDAATRIAVYEAAKAEGASEAEATFRAIQILDFSRRGSSQFLSLLTKLVPFLNARIQGLDVLYQAMMASGRYVTGNSYSERDANLGKKFLVRGAMLAAISMMLEMWAEDDDEYKDIPDYIKTSNLLIPMKVFGVPGQFIAIPKPFEAGLLFSTFPQQFYKTMRGEASSRENIALFTSQFAATFGVNPIPQVLKPAMEVLFNHDMYTGLPLISEGKARLTPELQYDSRTSSVARALSSLKIKYNFDTGKFEGVSPIVIEKLIGGYSGPMGMMLITGAGMMMERADIGPERLPRNFSEMPVIRRVFIDAESKSPKSVAQAYELFRIVDEANRSFSRLRQTGDAEAVMDFLEENRTTLAYKKYVFKLVDTLNKLSARERAIERDSSMTRDQKLEAMKKLREVRIRLTSKIDDINKALGR